MGSVRNAEWLASNTLVIIRYAEVGSGGWKPFKWKHRSNPIFYPLSTSHFRHALLSAECIKDPGCQMVSGSFDPVNISDWSDQAYRQMHSKGLVTNMAHILQRFLEACGVISEHTATLLSTSYSPSQ